MASWFPAFAIATDTGNLLQLCEFALWHSEPVFANRVVMETQTRLPQNSLFRSRGAANSERYLALAHRICWRSRTQGFRQASGQDHAPIIQRSASQAYSRSEFDLPDDAFRFMFSFDFGSFPARKNPEAVVRSFKFASPVFQSDSGVRDVCLVIKCQSSHTFPTARVVGAAVACPCVTRDNCGMRFLKYHALGNDYLVIDPVDHVNEFTAAEIIRICHRNFGIGSDGILWGPLPARDDAPFSLRIFNPDGGEAQKSGNGLRIFCRYLFDQGKVGHAPFKVHTRGGVVQATVHGKGESVTVEMGSVSFDSARIPVAGDRREVVRETLSAGGETLTFTGATIGNPHCVIERPRTSAADAHRLGPLIENHALFPERTNVQFLTMRDRGNIAIEIWERGAGYTLASGSSSSAAAAVAHRLGLVDRSVTVHMPGGTISIEIGDNYAITMTGPVTHVADGTLDKDLLENLR